jgi:hypothetical protein
MALSDFNPFPLLFFFKGVRIDHEDVVIGNEGRTLLFLLISLWQHQAFTQQLFNDRFGNLVSFFVLSRLFGYDSD